jgi:hypothetical protein
VEWIGVGGCAVGASTGHRWSRPCNCCAQRRFVACTVNLTYDTLLNASIAAGSPRLCFAGLSQHRCGVTNNNSSHPQNIAQHTSPSYYRCSVSYLRISGPLHLLYSQTRQHSNMAEPVPGFREQAKMAAGHVQATITVSMQTIDASLQAHTGYRVYSRNCSRRSCQLSVLLVWTVFVCSHVANVRDYPERDNVLGMCMHASCYSHTQAQTIWVTLQQHAVQRKLSWMPQTDNLQGLYTALQLAFEPMYYY